MFSKVLLKSKNVQGYVICRKAFQGKNVLQGSPKNKCLPYTDPFKNAFYGPSKNLQWIGEFSNVAQLNQ